MKPEEKALTEKVGSFLKAFAPTKVKDVRFSEADIVLPDNDVDNFIRVVMCYKTDAPLFPVFIVDAGTPKVSVMGDKPEDVISVWMIPQTGTRARVKIEKKYLKDVKKNGG